MIRKVVFLCLMMIASCGDSVSDTTSEAAKVGGELSTSLEVEFGKVDQQEDWNKTLSSFALIDVDLKVSKHIKMIFALKIRHLFSANGASQEKLDELDLWLEEAYVEIRQHGVSPVAFIIGKHPIAFGQGISDMPMFESRSPMHPKTNYSKKLGFSVSLEHIPFFDLVEFSNFSSTDEGLFIGENHGKSVRLTKKLTESLKTQASYLSDKKLNAVSLGFVFSTGEWTYWAEGVHCKGENDAFTVGASRSVYRGILAVEFSYILNSLAHYGLGYKIILDDYLTVGPEVRRTKKQNGSNSWEIGLKIEKKFEPVSTSSFQ